MTSASDRASCSRRRQEAGPHRQARATASPATGATATAGAGWQYVFVAIDDASRLGFARIYPDETADSALAFLAACAHFYAGHGIRIERVRTDNGTCFKRRWEEACAQRGIAVRKTRPYRPQTNGKVERSIRTLLELSAYAYPYANERERDYGPSARARVPIASADTARSEG